CANHGGTLPANKPKRSKGGRGYFQEVPTSDNLIAFKRAKALARRSRAVNAGESWIQYVSSITSSTTSQQLWNADILSNITVTLTCFELKRNLIMAHNTSPGPDGISYVLLRHLSEDSLRCESLSKPLEGVVKHLLGGGSNIITPSVPEQSYSRIDYGCVVYGSAYLYSEKALRPRPPYGIENLLGCVSHITGAEFYVNCHQLPLDLRRRSCLLRFILRSCPCLHILCRMCI
ncbi:hypothetical protein TNCV_984931, partial [Trichonephila clavipes]